MYNIEILKVSNSGFINYSYIVSSERDKIAVLIDPAWDFAQINEAVKSSSINLMGILLTHHHFDHMNLAEAFSELYSIPIFMSTIECKDYNLQFKNKKLFEDNETLRLSDNLIVDTILTPGHTSGSSCFLIGRNLFSGDTLFIEGCGSCNGIGSDASILFDSLRKLTTKIDDETLIYPGHRYSSDIPKNFSEVKNLNIYIQIKEKNQFIKFRTENTDKNFSFN